MNKKLFFIINFLVSALILVVLLRDFGWKGVAGNIVHADLKILVVAVIISVVFRLGFFPYIWKKILDYNKISAGYFDLLKVNAASLPLKFILPFKMSELTRAAGLKIFSGQDFTLSFGSTIFLRVVIFVATLEILFVGAVLKDKLLVAGLAVTSLVVLIIAIEKIVNSLVVDRKGWSWVGGITYCFKKISSVQLVKLNLLGLIFQCGEVLCAGLILASLGIKFAAGSLIYFISLMMVATSLPISIQGLGIRESVAVVSLAGAVSPSAALSFGILQSGVYHILPAIVGGVVWVVDFAIRIFSFGLVSGMVKEGETR